jgi:hypothetical protein
MNKQADGHDEVNRCFFDKFLLRGELAKINNRVITYGYFPKVL